MRNEIRKRAKFDASIIAHTCRGAETRSYQGQMSHVVYVSTAQLFGLRCLCDEQAQKTAGQNKPAPEQVCPKQTSNPCQNQLLDRQAVSPDTEFACPIANRD